MNEKYGQGTVKLEIHEQYRNMIEKVAPCMQLVDYAKDAIRELGMEPNTDPIRGGTDGAQLSFRGLPCPNLGTGGYAFHGPYEHITAEGMDTAVHVMLGNFKEICAVTKKGCEQSHPFLSVIRIIPEDLLKQELCQPRFLRI